MVTKFKRKKEINASKFYIERNKMDYFFSYNNVLNNNKSQKEKATPIYFLARSFESLFTFSSNNQYN